MVRSRAVASAATEAACWSLLNKGVRAMLVNPRYFSELPWFLEPYRSRRVTRRLRVVP